MNLINKSASLLLLLTGSLVAMGCAAEATPGGPEEPSPQEKTEDEPAPVETPIETTTKAATKCPPKPGYILCSCGICAYESSCRTVCN